METLPAGKSQRNTLSVKLFAPTESPCRVPAMTQEVAVSTLIDREIYGDRLIDLELKAWCWLMPVTTIDRHAS